MIASVAALVLLNVPLVAFPSRTASMLLTLMNVLIAVLAQVLALLTLPRLNNQKNIENAALLLERNAKQNCPVDTGKLRASITTEVGKLEAEVGTNVEYALCVEFGTSKQSAQPFMRPAFDKAITQLHKDMVKTLGGK